MLLPVWDRGARPQEGGSQHQGRPVGAYPLPWAGFCGRYSGPEPDQETTPAPQRWTNFPIQQKREQASTSRTSGPGPEAR